MEHLPLLRFGKPYESSDKTDVLDYNGTPLASASTAIMPLMRADIRQQGERARRLIRSISAKQLHEWIAKAGSLFAAATLRCFGLTQSVEEYCDSVSRATGLPLAMCHDAVHEMEFHMGAIEDIVSSQCFGCSSDVLDTGRVAFGPRVHRWIPTKDLLCAVMPGNHPLVNMMWVIALALKYPVVVKPSMDDPFTPLRLIMALVEAGVPAEFFAYYPTDHASVLGLLSAAGAGIVFGGPEVEKLYGPYPWIRVYGPGSSKIVIGEDSPLDDAEVAERVADSALYHSGRACISTSAVVTEKDGRALAEAIAGAFDAVRIRPLDDPDAQLAAEKRKPTAVACDTTIRRALQSGEAVLLRRARPVFETVRGRLHLMPTVLYCPNARSEIFGRELPFPFVTVTEAPRRDVPAAIGKTLSCSVSSRSESLLESLSLSARIDKLRVGLTERTRMDYGAPHNGFLSELLYEFKALSFSR